MSKVTEEELVKAATGKRVTLGALEANIADEKFIKATDVLTICVLTLKNGFTVTGESACADPSNYNQEIGERLAREQAKNKIWPLMGYSLRQELYEMGEGTTFVDRMRKELTELQDKINKANAFILGNEQFKRLDEDEQNDLVEQRNAMQTYGKILVRRLNREGNKPTA